MKVLTLNTWQERGAWEKRWDIIFEGLEKERPDLVFFQETFNEKWIREAAKLAGYDHVVFAFDKSGLSIFSNFPVDQSDCLTLKTQSPTEDYLRYALYARVHTPGGWLHLFNTHLSWKLDEGFIREKQVDELLNYIDDKAGVGEAIVTGDFNAPPQNPEVRKMIVRGKFNDTYAVKHPKEAGLTWDNRNPYANGSSVLMPDRRIDYIFIRNQAKVLGKLAACDLIFTEAGAQGIYASDHYGVLASFN